MRNWLRAWLGFDIIEDSAHTLYELHQEALKMIREEREAHANERRELRGEIQALTQSLARALSKAEVPVVYPHTGPLEPSPGWFDGKPSITQVNGAPIRK